MSLEVVIVDDDKIIIYLQKITLAKSGLCTNPITHHNGKELLDYLKRERDAEKKYLVLLDLAMPEMNGWEFMEEIKNKPYNDRVFVIIVNSSTSVIDTNKALSYKNVIGIYDKPIDIDSCNRIKFIPVISRFFKNNIE
jgi:CheY-like chemotaxis protein